MNHTRTTIWKRLTKCSKKRFQEKKERQLKLMVEMFGFEPKTRVSVLLLSLSNSIKEFENPI